MGEFVSVNSYARYCTGLLRFREPLERAVAAIIPDGIDGWQSLPLADALRSDLRDLGHPGDMESSAQVQPLDSNSLLGALYVLEGSSLGAQLLVKRAAALGLTAQHGARHLDLQTNDRQRWTRFVEILEQHGIQRPDAVARGAEDTFAHALKSFLADRNDN